MKFESKFDIGETVYYWSVEKVKILFGRIEAISLYQAEDKEPVWRYSMHHIDPKKYQPILIREQVPEHLVFRKRDDVFDFCMKLTEGI
jgi:hypothetical protein